MDGPLILLIVAALVVGVLVLGALWLLFSGGSAPAQSPARGSVEPHQDPVAAEDRPVLETEQVTTANGVTITVVGDNSGAGPARIALPIVRRYQTPPGTRWRTDSIRVADYLPPEDEGEALTVDAQGYPRFRLVRAHGQLVMEAPGGGWINPKSRRLHRTCVVCFQIRGTSYYDRLVHASETRPLTSLMIVREPGNVHDPNAVSLYTAEGVGPLGYVNRQNAARLAPRIDRGETLAAITLRGTARDTDGPAPRVLIGPAHVIEHLADDYLTQRNR